MILPFSQLKLLIRLEKLVHVFIFLNLVAYALHTVHELEDYHFPLEIFETISLVVFSIEYFVRLYFAVLKKKPYSYVFSVMGIVDFVSVFPILLPHFSSLEFGWVKMLRLFRMVRIFKLYRYYEHLQVVVEVFRHKKEDLLSTFFSIMLVLVFCSSIAFVFEREVQPHAFGNIFTTLYWGVTTVTTLGYGDLYPITIGGRIISSILALLGIGLITMSAGILSAGFIEVNQHKKELFKKRRQHKRR